MTTFFVFLLSVGTCVIYTVASQFFRERIMGVFSSLCGVLFSVGALWYWRQIYRERGLRETPRISMREVLVIYLGMSVEVGLIVELLKGGDDLALAGFCMLLPPAIVAVIAFADDTPHRKRGPRVAGAVTRDKGSSSALPAIPRSAHPAQIAPAPARSAP